jgi:hypothetical protein
MGKNQHLARLRQARVPAEPPAQGLCLDKITVTARKIF